MLYAAALASAPFGLAENNQFFRPVVNGRIVLSSKLFVIGNSPSLRYSLNPFWRLNAYSIAFEIFDVGEAVYHKTGFFIPENGLESFRQNKILLKSPITTPIGKGFRSLNVTLRNQFDLWANIRPAKSNPCLDTLYKNIDIVTFRENTEDLYIGEEKKIDEDTVIAIKKITRTASQRIIRAAFEYCRRKDFSPDN